MDKVEKLKQRLKEIRAAKNKPVWRVGGNRLDIRCGEMGKHEIDRLRRALIECEHQTHSLRVWDGMESPVMFDVGPLKGYNDD